MRHDRGGGCCREYKCRVGRSPPADGVYRHVTISSERPRLTAKEDPGPPTVVPAYGRACVKLLISMVRVWHRPWRHRGLRPAIGDFVMSLDQIVFVRRQSPDWSGLAHDYEAGMPIDPARYAPGSTVPGFPDDIVVCIRAWNETFSVNFFRCRQVLKEISERLLRQISSATVVSEDRMGALPAMIEKWRCLLFFFDDDDLFAPNTFEQLSALDLGEFDIAVFPLVRFGVESFTFVRREEKARVVVGMRRNFGHRFQTNNYGITSGIALAGHLPRLKDHVLGSIHADQQNFRDAYFDVLIGATNKTPCSANTIGALPADRAAYRAFIVRYVENLRRLEIPPGLGWVSDSLDETIKLFGKV
jgi:hypothetical protein